ncbi:hypothetical protein [Phyllobacterium sp. 628]|uniref:hypothetical protein n=1 Tax=Phyllobacterium sp. 628 TaxID=2718938 RepID=UPI001FCE3F89|nr:hypothetical protein [Phyllobacterium sp. 628]
MSSTLPDMSAGWLDPLKTFGIVRVTASTALANINFQAIIPPKRTDAAEIQLIRQDCVKANAEMVMIDCASD